MTFTSNIFLIGLLPWFAILYRLLSNQKRDARKILLLLANTLFLVWGGIGSFLLICCFSLLVWALGTAISKTRQKWMLAVALILAVLPLVVIKYSLFLIGIVNSALGCAFAAPSIAVPIGISFITFEAISLLVDTYKGKVDKNPNLLDTFMYLTFFPTVTSGPIIRYNEYKAGITRRDYACDYTAAVERIVIGLCKKVLIADKLSIIADHYFDGIGVGIRYSTPGLWLGAIAFALQLYFDFSGYSDMAIGMGQLMGFDLRENFNKPYQAQSISDFWKRWHISLTQWFRDYVYIPLGGNRCPVPRHIVNMLVVWLVTGIWHGADWSFVLWGLAYFVLLTAEKYIPAIRKHVTGAFGHIYTLFFVVLLWVPFRASSLNAAARYLQGMFGGGSGPVEEKAIRFIPLIALAGLLCFSWDRILKKYADRKTMAVLRGVVLIALAVLAICGAINSAYAPYIYGNF